MDTDEDPIMAAARKVETIRVEYETLNMTPIPDDLEERIVRRTKIARLGLDLEAADSVFYQTVQDERQKVL